MSELPSDLPRLRAILAYLDQRLAESETVATYLRLQTTAVRQALAAAEKRPANGRRLPPPMQQRSALPAPAQHDAGGFVVEKQLHAGHPLGATIHRADCTVIQRDANPISADDGRQALTGDGKFFHACEFCRPDAHLGIPG